MSHPALQNRDPNVRFSGEFGHTGLQQFQRWGLFVGTVAFVLCIVIWALRPDLMMPAYLIAVLYFWMIALGSLAIRLLHALTGGDWGTSIRPPLTAAAATLPRLGLLFLPVLLQLRHIYVWAESSATAQDGSLHHLAGYLNPAFFQVRSVGYFLIWSATAALVLRSDRREQTTRSSQPVPSIERFAAPAFVIWVLTTTFAAFDWGMSLEPHWNSSIYGVLYMAGQGVSALAAAVVCSLVAERNQAKENEVSPDVVHDLGNLLLAFTLFWTYIELTQFLVIWSGNLPEEVPWYLRRQAGGWKLVVVALVGFHFIFPFLLLLSRTVKRNARYLLGVASLLLLMRLLDLVWLILPAYDPPRSLSLLCLPLTLAAVGGIWLADFIQCWSNQHVWMRNATSVDLEVNHD